MVVPGRASGIKMIGWQRWEHQLVWVGWQSIRIVGVSACAIFILHQKIQKVAKCTFWYQLTRVVPDKVQRNVKWLCARKTFGIISIFLGRGRCATCHQAVVSM